MLHGPRPSSPHVLAVARGDEPADLLLRGGRVLSPSTREWVTTDLAIADGVVAGWGPRDAIEEVDLDGAAVTAGLVDAHMHLESTKLWIDEFVRTVLPLGTTAVAADPHEVANVFGIPGVAALIAAARQLPFTFGVCASSCVPASPFESPGAELFAADVATLLDEYAAIGVAEVMNFPGVIAGDPEMLARIATAGSRRVDGHAPGSRAPCSTRTWPPGVESDHECTELAEAEEKRRKGMWIFIRQGSASQNLRDLIPTVLAHGTDHVALCSDDREPDTLLEAGHLNDCVQLAVEAGVSEIDALVLATLNPAEYHGFTELGALGPGLPGRHPLLRHARGIPALARLPARPAGGPRRCRRARARWSTPRPRTSCADRCTCRSPPPAAAFGDAVVAGARVRTIGIHDGSLTTSSLVTDPSDPRAGVARLAVVERHRQTGRIGLGWVQGFGLTQGALASTVGHDAHNCMVVGARSPSGRRPWRPPWPAWPRSAAARWPSTIRAPCWPSCRCPSGAS